MGRTNRLSPLDASFLYWERPNHRMHVGCVALLDGRIPFEPFAQAMEERLGGIPRYRERPVRPFLDLGWPRWEVDATFNVRRHLRHVAVPPTRMLCAPPLCARIRRHQRRERRGRLRHHRADPR